MATYNHFLHLAADAHPLDNLDVLEARQDLVLDLEDGLHAELGTLLDREGLLLQVIDRAGSRQINDNVGPALDLHGALLAMLVLQRELRGTGCLPRDRETG